MDEPDVDPVVVAIAAFVLGVGAAMASYALIEWVLGW